MEFHTNILPLKIQENMHVIQDNFFSNASNIPAIQLRPVASEIAPKFSLGGRAYFHVSVAEIPRVFLEVRVVEVVSEIESLELVSYKAVGFFLVEMKIVKRAW